MVVSRLVLLNASLLTAYGSFTYEPISLDNARQLVREFRANGKIIQSAIGHQPTAELLTDDLDCDVRMSRQEVTQTTDDLALVFNLKKRPREGEIFTREELEAIGYEFGLLRRIE